MLCTYVRSEVLAIESPNHTVILAVEHFLSVSPTTEVPLTDVALKSKLYTPLVLDTLQEVGLCCAICRLACICLLQCWHTYTCTYLIYCIESLLTKRINVIHCLSIGEQNLSITDKHIVLAHVPTLRLRIDRRVEPLLLIVASLSSIAMTTYTSVATACKRSHLNSCTIHNLAVVQNVNLKTWVAIGKRIGWVENLRELSCCRVAVIITCHYASST